ncbi:MAG: type II secretion system protein [Planctomycetota bacterium]|jgi:prepilin-type N-terminal cleavage/methylation domain-containing protein/prepilin-type processing-associated H-X9-DG protein
MKQKAFTLVELLAVIFILGLLLSVLFPVLRKSREKARSLNCSLNLKKIAAVMLIYEQNDGTFPQGFDQHNFEIPPGGYFYGDSLLDFRGWWWFDFLKENFDEQNNDKGKLLRCPSRNVQDTGVEENMLCGNYGVNRFICKDNMGIFLSIDSEFIGTPLSINQIKQTSESMLIMDSGYTLISWKAAVEKDGRLYENVRRERFFYVPGLKVNKQRDISNECLKDANFGRHSNKSVNIAFIDMHVENRKADDFLVQQVDDEYVNLEYFWKAK